MSRAKPEEFIDTTKKADPVQFSDQINTPAKPTRTRIEPP